MSDRLTVLATVTGFVPDAEALAELHRREGPFDAYCALVPQSDFELLATTNWATVDPEDVVLDDHDELLGIGEFGEVRLAPTPDLELLAKLAEQAGCTPLGVDLDDEAHTAAYTENVGVRDLWALDRVRRKLNKMNVKKFESAHEWVLAREALRMGVKGYAKVEQARIAHMREQLPKGKVLLLVPPHIEQLLSASSTP